MTSTTRQLLIPLATVAVLFLAGCGGSSNGNAAPSATNSSHITSEDTPFNSTLVANDPENNPLTYSIVSNGSLGTAVVTNAATGAYSYTPNANADGSDSFTFKANDGSQNSNVATVFITITAVNDPPVAQAGALNVNENTAANGTLAATDIDSTTLTHSIVSNGVKGTATITNAITGAYTYTPNPGASGGDSFTFKANDGFADSNVATVSVTINAAPVATASCGTTPQENVFSGTLVATDAETPGMLMYALLSPVDGSDQGSGPITTANGGVVTITNATTGAYTYQPNNLGGRGRDTFDFRVTDPGGATGTATETVIVNQKIMPLGDSITAGVEDKNGNLPADNLKTGYRLPLNNLLTGSGYTFDFVGTLAYGSGITPAFDIDNEGHPGFCDDEIAWGELISGMRDPNSGVVYWLNQNPADIILLHIGTNCLDTSPTDVQNILDNIDSWENSANGNHVTVVLAQIIDKYPVAQPTDMTVETFNSNVVAMANTRIANGDDIVIVNQYGALNYPAGDLGDDIHPTSAGYTKMANIWFNNALTSLLDKCP